MMGLEGVLWWSMIGPLLLVAGTLISFGTVTVSAWMKLKKSEELIEVESYEQLWRHGRKLCEPGSSISKAYEHFSPAWTELPDELTELLISRWGWRWKHSQHQRGPYNAGDRGENNHHRIEIVRSVGILLVVEWLRMVRCQDDWGMWCCAEYRNWYILSPQLPPKELCCG